MTRVGWLADKPSFVGGAELTEREFRAAAPEGVEVVDCAPGEVDPTCDRFAIHNCVTYSINDLHRATNKPTVKFWNDVGSWYDEAVRWWLDGTTMPICCSPLQAEYMGYSDALLIPPPVNLDRFYEAASKVNGDRSGAVSVGSWRNRGKGAHRVEDWAAANGVDVKFFGGGPFAPRDSRQLAYEMIPAVLARHQTFVFLPDVIEPFGRCVVEAWAAGNELVVNDLVGAKYWIEKNPEALTTAAETFWKVVLNGEEADSAGQVQPAEAGHGDGAARDRGASAGHGGDQARAGVGVQQAAGEDASRKVGQAAR